MIDLVIGSDCENTRLYDQNMSLIKESIENIQKQLGVETLNKVIVVGLKENSWSSSINKYAPWLPLNTEKKQYDSHGKAICRIDEHGCFEQLIFIDECFFIPWVYGLLGNDMAALSQLGDNNIDIALLISKSGLHHEIGHSLDYQIKYQNHKYISPDCQFDLNNFNECEEYYKHSSLMIWSEFYAQTIAYRYSPPTQIQNEYFANEINILIANAPLYNLECHSYRLAYFTAHFMAAVFYGYDIKYIENLLIYDCLELDNNLKRALIEFGKLLCNNYNEFETWDFDKVATLFLYGYRQIIFADKAYFASKNIS